MNILFNLGILFLVVGFGFGWYSGAHKALSVGNIKSLQVRVYVGLTIVGFLFLLGGSIKALYPRRASHGFVTRDVLSNATEFTNEANANLEKVNEDVARNDRKLNEWESLVTNKLKSEPIQFGKSRLFYVEPKNTDDREYKIVMIFIRHLSDNKVPKSVEQRGDEQVTIWSNLNGDFINAWLPIFDNAKIRAWKED